MYMIIYVGFAAAVAVDVWAAIAVIFQRRFTIWLVSLYFVITFLVFASAWQGTFHFGYYSNPNTQIAGWPIPSVIFHRDTPTSPWLDYVGPTTALACPMNFVIFMVIPSVVFIILAMRRRRQKHETVA